MDLKSVILFLGLWKTISCKNCEYKIDENRFNIYSGQCNVTVVCEETSDITCTNRIRQSLRRCSSWKGTIRFSNICKYDPYETITCNQYESDCNKYLEFEIINSACSYIPTFHNSPNVEAIIMHNTNLVDLSIVSHNLHKLALLDLSQNKVSNISNLELYSSGNLKVLNLSYNNIHNINDQVFRHIPSLTKLDLMSNMIDNITSKTFYGLHNLNILNLSYNKISNINSAFDNLIVLEEIYLNHNNLQEIKENDFEGLDELRILKINSNTIINIDWIAMQHIPMLKVFDASYNNIKNVTKSAFKNNNFLNYVDLSFNNITRIFPNMFFEKNIIFFAIKSNNLDGILEFGIFEGIKASDLDLSHQNIDAVGDNAFYGLTGLTTLLLNDNKIKNISRTAFESLTSLQLLDLSNNMLHVIDFNMKEFTNLKNLRLKNNLISDIKPINSGEMPCLEFLDLSYNNLTSLNSDTYGVILPQLKELNVSHNSLRNIQDDIFEKFEKLLWIDLSFNCYLTNTFNLTNHTLVKDHTDIYQASEFKSVGISHCEMDNLLFLKLHVFKTITSLDLNYNKIHKIEYGMFSSNKELIYLDLSYNKISHIQPGSFKDNNVLKELNVGHNELLQIEYGCFGGLNQLNLLDISFNKINSFKHGRFYETPSLNTLIADNNNIDSIEYQDFVGANLSKLSIGGNPLPCLFLINLQSETHSLQVTTLNAELHLPNFKGITCKPGSYKYEKLFNSSNYTSDIYSERRVILLEDIRNILLEIKKTNNSEAPNSSKSSGLLHISNLTESINQAFYKIAEANDRLYDGIVDLFNNSVQAQARNSNSKLAQNIVERLNKSDEINSRIIQLITDMYKNNSNLVKAYDSMSSLTQNIIKTLNRSDDTSEKLIQLITKIDQNAKKNIDILDYFKNKFKPSQHNPNDTTQEINEVNEIKHVNEHKNNITSQGSKSVDGDEATERYDKFESNIVEPMQPNQMKTMLFEIRAWLSIITVVMFCSILYKIYELNLFRSLRRRRSASTQHINESIATATL